jgi:hypothetical protein
LKQLLFGLSGSEKRIIFETTREKDYVHLVLTYRDLFTRVHSLLCDMLPFKDFKGDGSMY